MGRCHEPRLRVPPGDRAPPHGDGDRAGDRHALGGRRRPRARLRDRRARARRRRRGGQPPRGLARTVVPAAPAAWLAALERWGTMSFADVAASATEHASRGFPVSRFSAYQMAANADKYRRWPTSVALYLKDGRAYRVGELLVQKELGETLRRMARAEARAGGSREAGIRAARDEFYRGETAKRIAEFHH